MSTLLFFIASKRMHMLLLCPKIEESDRRRSFMDDERTDFPSAFGNRLRRCRRNRDRTQAEIAAAIGMERAQYSQLEGGRYRSMQLEQIVRLAESLNTS